MLLPKTSDAVHKAWLYTVLTEIADHRDLSRLLRFKGGTCAAMLGWINRFSVDLDFDLIDERQVAFVQKELEKIFKKLSLEIKDKSQKAPQYFLKYPAALKDRNTLKLDVSFPPVKANDYEPYRFEEIDRIFHCQTPSTMFANKLVALMDRYEKTGSIAGRDLFDIHTFFTKGFTYKPEVIEERRGVEAKIYLKELKKFIQEEITQTVIDQDLNTLVPPVDFKKLRLILKPQVLIFLGANEFKMDSEES
ncbi:nucleotidyl transferase AbiEii/AbiGii toxin family protein [Candidatus Peregrinibacteria bacterium]|nr:MAG: nucleotidyl transferase AbiEii/AbiGii toxin family protein [Candidatus Peregrinibacteria bacterium]